MQLVEIPQALPGSCKACGSGSKPPYIDTETSEEFHGAVYYCHECAGQIAQLLGYISPVQAQTLITENVDLAEQNFNLKVEVDNLRKAVDGLVKSGYNSPVSVSDPVVGSVRSDPDLLSTLDGSEDEGPGELSQGTESSVGSREGETSEPSHDEGVAELHADDESNGFSLHFNI